MGFEFSDSIKRGASCCEVVYMGCEFEIILKDDTQYFQIVNSGNIRQWRRRKQREREKMHVGREKNKAGNALRISDSLHFLFKDPNPIHE